MNNGLNIQIKETAPISHNILENAKVTEEGKIQLYDGRIFSVNLTSEGKTHTLESGEDLKKLAEKALKILKQTGQQFETLDKLSINKHKIDHLKGGKTETIHAKDQDWGKTAEKAINKFLKILPNSDKKSEMPKIEEKKETKIDTPVLKFEVKEKTKISEKKTEKEQHKEQVSQLIANSKKGVLGLSSDIVKLLSEKNPEIGKEIKTFSEQHQKKIGVLKEKPWLTLKKDPELGGIKMAQKKDNPNGKDKPPPSGEEYVSFEDFRQETNKLTVKLVNLAMEEMGLPPIKAGGAGTPGYNSDVDLNMKSEDPKRPLTTGDMVIARSLANMISTEILGQMPGLSIDTEWYVDRKFLGEQAQTTEAKQQIATLDLAMGIVQAKEGFKEHPKQYESFKERQLDKSSPKEIREVKKQLFEQAEALYEKMELQTAKELLLQKGIDSSQMSNKQIFSRIEEFKKDDKNFSENYYKAKVVVQYRSHLALGEECAKLEKQIEDGQKNKMDPKELDVLIVKHDTMYALINCTQAEGTMSSSELQTTLDSRLGQIAQRKLEVNIKDLGKAIKEQSGRKSPTRSRKGSLEHLKSQTGVLEQIETKRDRGMEYTIPQLLLAGQERLAQFSHKIQENHKEAPIEAGKYCLRVAESNYHALQKFQESHKEPLPKEFNGLFEKAQKNYQIAKDLEQAKRSFFLNTPTTKRYLKDILKETKDGDFDDILQKEGNQTAKLGGLIKKSEKMNVLLTGLQDKNYINKEEKKLLLQKPIGKKPSEMKQEKYDQLVKLQNVLHARAGYKKEKTKYKALEEIHKNSKEQTLKAYNLQEKKDILNFGKEIESFTLDVQKFMHKNGVMPKFSQNFSNQNNFAKTWPGQ